MKCNRFSLISGIIALGAAAAHAQVIGSTDQFGYTGTVTYYSSLADANSQTDGTQYNFQQRDGSVYIGYGNQDTSLNGIAFETNWYSNGGNNPNDNDNSFLQLNTGSATDAVETGAFSADLNSFTLSDSGTNLTYADAYSRLWNAGQTDVGGEGTIGTWLNYSFNLTATGLNGVNSGGFITNTTNASSYSGGFTGLFQNLSVSSPQSDGFYAVNLAVNDTSWMVSNGFGDADQFQTPSGSPEPAAMAVMWGSAIPFVVGAIRRRRKVAS